MNIVRNVAIYFCSCEHTLNTLRYADRVKELGTEEPINGGKLDAEANLEDDTMASEDSDLAQLRHMNDGECSADWYHFQENIAQLQVPLLVICLFIPFLAQVLEEDVVESHRALVASMEQWLQQDSILIAMTNEVDYDQDGEFSSVFVLFYLHALFPAYGQLLEEMVAEKKAALEELENKTRAFR